MAFWLLKSEPNAFSLDDLISAPQQTTFWDGVRNYQARNFLRDQMRVGDQAFFYHSNCEVPGIVGLVEISKAAYPDASAFDPASPYYDPQSNPANPRWYGVAVKLIRPLRRLISLSELRTQPPLADMLLLRKGNRLSITPITAAQWHFILAME